MYFNKALKLPILEKWARKQTNTTCLITRMSWLNIFPNCFSFNLFSSAILVTILSVIEKVAFRNQTKPEKIESFWLVKISDLLELPDSCELKHDTAKMQ